MNKIKLFGALLIALVFSLSAQSQLEVDNTMTATEAVLDVLLGDGVEVSNVTFNGSPGDSANIQIGFFDSQNSNIGICQGVVIGSCDVVFTIGPNNEGGAGLGADPNYGLTNDPDLATIEGLTDGNDQAALEFDFVPSTNSVNFNYVFSSEEYPEFVNAGFNDAFGFFLSGPGITGPFSNSAVNLALIPDTDTPVTIDNVNDGLNAEFYVSNEPPADGNVTQMDGFTVPLTATYPVTAGETYHIKMAIGNSGDSAWDSAVFLQKESFGSGIQTSAGLDEIPGFLGDTTIVEGCNVGNIAITWTDLATADTLFLEYSGTFSEEDLDTDLPDFLVFTADETEQTIDFGAILDNEDEGTEEIIVSYTYLDECDNEVTVSASLFIIENQPPVVNIDDQTICPGTSTSFSLFPEDGIGFYAFELNGEVIDQSQVFQTFTPEATTVYNYTISDPCGNSVSNQFTINVLEADPLQVPNIEESALCPGDEVLLTALPSGGHQPLTYDWPENAAGNVPEATVVPPYFGSLIVTDFCNNQVTVGVTASVPFYDPLLWEQEIPLWCAGTSQIVEALSGGTGVYSFSTEPAGGIAPITNASGDETITLVPIGSGSFEIIVVDQCGNTNSIPANINPCSLDYTNVFTPNGDDMNPTLVIQGVEGFPGSKLTIFDRWGLIIYEDNNYSNDWEGLDEKGNEFPSGTYYYVFEPNSSLEEPRSGFFTIVR